MLLEEDGKLTVLLPAAMVLVKERAIGVTVPTFLSCQATNTGIRRIRFELVLCA